MLALGETLTGEKAQRHGRVKERAARETERGDEAGLIKLVPARMRHDVEQQCRQSEVNDETIELGCGGRRPTHLTFAQGSPQE